MEIKKKRNGGMLTMEIIGRLDTMTSNQLEAELKKVDGGVEKLVLDCTNLEYITSVGIRIFISANKMMRGHNGLVLRGLNGEVAEVLEVTGVLDLFEVE